MHFGEELYRKALPYQLRIIEHLMSLGVQVIIGAHPHVLQQHCLHDNKLVAYSLGNFLFHPRRPMSGVNPVIPDTGQKNVQQNSSIWPCLLHYKPLKLFAQSLGRIILRGQCVSRSRGPSESRLLSRIRHRNASTEKAWEDAAQEPGNQVMSIVKYITLSKANTEPKMNDKTGTTLFAS